MPTQVKKSSAIDNPRVAARRRTHQSVDQRLRAGRRLGPVARRPGLRLKINMDIKSDRTAWLKAGAARCAAPANLASEKPLRLVLLGAPGVGKGTQAELLGAHLGACHLSTGDIFRAAKAMAACDRSPALSAALEYMRRGELVPDDTVLKLVSERLGCLKCEGGFLLDGFPRTVGQAEALDDLLTGQGLGLDAVVSYELPLEQVVARLSGRRTCPDCKAVFHIEARPPKQSGICDHCGGKLYQREDDRPESIRVRMHAYETSTAPLAEFYRKRNLLVTIPADGSPEEIFKRTCTQLDDLKDAEPAPKLADPVGFDGRKTRTCAADRNGHPRRR